MTINRRAKAESRSRWMNVYTTRQRFRESRYDLERQPRLASSIFASRVRCSARPRARLDRRRVRRSNEAGKRKLAQL